MENDSEPTVIKSADLGTGAVGERGARGGGAKGNRVRAVDGGPEDDGLEGDGQERRLTVNFEKDLALDAEKSGK